MSKDVKKSVGVWIDHREAVIVFAPHHEAEVSRIESHVEKHLRRTGESPLNEPYESQLVPADDSQQKGFTGHLAAYYEKVIAIIRAADEILIFGPGEAKGELHKQLEKDHLGDRVTAVETADKMTEPQVVQYVRKHFDVRGSHPKIHGS